MEKNDNKWLTTDEMMALLMSEPDREMEFTVCLGGLLRSTHWCLAFYDFYMSRLLLKQEIKKTNCLNALFVSLRLDVISYNDDLLKRLVR